MSANHDPVYSVPCNHNRRLLIHGKMPHLSSTGTMADVYKFTETSYSTEIDVVTSVSVSLETVVSVSVEIVPTVSIEFVPTVSVELVPTSKLF
jgi:hypothetical protein